MPKSGGLAGMAWAAMTAAAMTVAGCGQAPSLVPPERQAVSAPLVWPDPPERARIRFNKAVATPADLGIQPSFWERLGEIITGKAEAWMIRPTGVAARGEMLYVADPGAQALWILDGAVGRFKEIRGPLGQRLASPVAVALGRGGKIYVADSFLRKIFIFNHDGELTGTVEQAPFVRPAGVAYDEVADRLYVADSAAHRIWILSGDGASRTLRWTGLATCMSPTLWGFGSRCLRETGSSSVHSVATGMPRAILQLPKGWGWIAKGTCTWWTRYSTRFKSLIVPDSSS